jgi:hypothetical protein
LQIFEKVIERFILRFWRPPVHTKARWFHGTPDTHVQSQYRAPTNFRSLEKLKAAFVHF